MSSKPPLRKSKHKDEMKTEIVAQVHKSTKREISSDRETQKTEASEESSGSNKTFIKDEISSYHNTPSRDVSVDNETQINSKIIGLIEAEIKRETKHATFSDSRPQSLSFYEEEKIPEELSGNLELLSPEERKYYRRRKDADERNIYNSIQDIYTNGNEDIMMTGSLKKSKSRKKKHGDHELGISDSRELMIPREKRKSKKKKHESSPVTGKRKHRKREDEYECKNEITTALDELQDDVFENNVEENNQRHEKVKKSPKKNQKLFVQKKKKFDVVNRNDVEMENHPISQQFPLQNPTLLLYIAMNIQKTWRKFTMFCHGLLGGLGFAHCVYISTISFTNMDLIRNYAGFVHVYVTLFYVLCILCLVSVFDKYDIGNLSVESVKGFVKNFKGCLVVGLYLITLALHLATSSLDDKIISIAENSLNVTFNDSNLWNGLSASRAMFAFTAWFVISLSSSEDYLYLHLQNMEVCPIPKIAEAH